MLYPFHLPTSKRATSVVCALLFAIAWLSVGTPVAEAVRIKEVTTVAGDREHVLIGYGVVVGLAGTGGKGPLTRQLMLNFLQRSGLRADPAARLAIQTNTQQKTENLAAVTVTVRMPAFAKKGQTLSASVQALDAESLQNGELLPVALRGIDDKVYGMASGKISIGGFSAKGQNASVQSNHTTRGNIPQGFTVERTIPFKPGVGGCIQLLLREPSFANANRISKAINEMFAGSARALDASMVDVIIPPSRRLNVVRFIDEIQALEFEPDDEGEIVINEATGTIVIGKRVRIAKVAINHGNLTVLVAESPQVSQPAPFSQGVTTQVPRSTVQVEEERSPIAVLEETVTVDDLAQALNAMGVSPRDLSSILQQLHAAGAVYANVRTN